ncbi:MAG TPA: hypothetical protein VLJ86_00900 [Ramlibacter sp.]|nr:hypothetical protein [Ramlibacter sp.]
MHPLLVEGLSDAVGFIGGALLGYWVGQMFGLDALAEGYDSTVLAGIVLITAGGGAGLQLARRWQRSRATKG